MCAEAYDAPMILILGVHRAKARRRIGGPKLENVSRCHTPGDRMVPSRLDDVVPEPLNGWALCSSFFLLFSPLTIHQQCNRSYSASYVPFIANYSPVCRASIGKDVSPSHFIQAAHGGSTFEDFGIVCSRSFPL